MTKKKTKKSSCCTVKKIAPLFIITLIVLITVAILGLPGTPDKEGLIANDSEMVIEMISDTVEVTVEDSDIIEDNDEEISMEEPSIIVLDEKSSLVSPEMTTPEKLVRTFLHHYNQERFKDACDIISDIKCDDRIKGSVARFGEEFEKIDGGYQNVSVKQVDIPDFHSDVVCVEYDYRYKASTNPNLIHETMSFYLQDGKITYRICEEKTRDGVNIKCPILSRRDFCL